MPDSAAKHPRTLRRKFAFAAVATAVALIGAELVARWLAPSRELHKGHDWLVSTHLVDMPFEDFLRRQREIQDARERQGMERGRSHPIFGWTYNPNFRLDVEEIQIHVNSLALRGEEFPEKKPDGELRVLCLGGSTTGCEEVTETRTWPAQLQALLRARMPGRAIRVINAGIPTYDTRMSWTDYALRLYKLEPDVVLIYHGINDLGTHTRGGPSIEPVQNYSGRPMEPFLFEGDARKHSFLEDLRAVFGHSQLVRFADDAWKRLRSAREPGLTDPDPGGLAAFAANYRALVRDIQATGGRAVPMTFQIAWPGTFTPEDQKKIDASFAIYLSHDIHSKEVGRRILERYNDSIRAIAREERAEICEIEGRVPADRQHFVDCCHFTDEGNRVVAEALAPVVEPLLEAGDARAVPATLHR